jgi:hypothetical protein
MKKILLFFVALLAFVTACKDKEEDAPAPQTKIDLAIKKEKLGASGKVSVDRAAAIMHMWRTEDAEFDVEDPSADMRIGYAYDKVSGSHKASEYGAIGSVMREPVKPGRYFVYVSLMKSSGPGSLAYSYTTVDIKEGETLKLEKVFKHDVGTEQYEEWGESK